MFPVLVHSDCVGLNVQILFWAFWLDDCPRIADAAWWQDCH
jgi:hypothetical protein